MTISADAVDGLALQRIGEVPHLALDLARLDLEVGDGGLELRVPVHQALVAIDQPVLMQLHEHLADRRRKALVEGEPLARPVAGGAEAAKLAGDRATGLRLPVPDALEEGLASHVAAALIAGGGELALHHHLGGDARVVGAGQPQHRLAPHPPKARQHILQGGVQRVTEMERARHVRRRDDDAVGLGIRDFARKRRLGPEGAGGLPGGVEARLHGSWGRRSCRAWVRAMKTGGAGAQRRAPEVVEEVSEPTSLDGRGDDGTAYGRPRPRP